MFFIQESSYSAYITIRKKFRKDATRAAILNVNSSIAELEAVKKDMENMTAKYEESVIEAEELKSEVLKFKNLVDIVHQKLAKAEENLKRSQRVNEKLLDDVKNLTNENDTFGKKKSDMNIDLENTRKHLKDTSHLFEKKSKQMEAKIKDLTDFKEAKMSEEKKLKGKQKKLERRKRILVEKEPKLKDENEKQEVNEN